MTQSIKSDIDLDDGVLPLPGRSERNWRKVKQITVPLSQWVYWALRLRVPHVGAWFSPEFPREDPLKALDGDLTPEFRVAVDETKTRLQALRLLSQDGRYIIRYNTCATENVKVAMGTRGTARWSKEFDQIIVDSPRLDELSYGIPRNCLAVRQWFDAVMIDEFPVEFRAFFGPGGFRGISSYYPQRPLPATNEIMNAIGECIYYGKVIESYLIKVHREMKVHYMGFTVDFMYRDHPERGRREVVLLEGGPPHTKTNGAHPCCFEPGEISGIALESRWEGAFL